MNIPDEVRLVAHELFSLSPLPPHAERVEGDGYVLTVWATPDASFNTVMRLRLPEDGVNQAVEEARQLFRERDRARATWWVSSSATPENLVERLIALGMRPNDEPPAEPRARAMVMLEPPRAGPADVVARPARDFDEYRTGSEIVRAASGMRPLDAVGVERLRLSYEGHLAGRHTGFVAWVDGAAAAAGGVLFTAHAAGLGGAGTLPEFRGRGAYTALVRARWDAAVERGTPALVIQAGAMSLPILERLGFQSVGDIEILLDDFGRSRAS